jgi:hypothetical protein
VVRRLKRHVKITHPKTNQPVEFPERQVQPLPVVMDAGRHADFLAAQRELLAFVAPELRRAMRSRRYDDALAYLALLKRSVSTAYALHSTVRKVRDRFQSLAHQAVEEADARRNRIRTLKAIQRKAAKFGILTPAEEEERELMEVEDLAQQLNFLTREERGRRLEADQAESLAESLSRVADLAGHCLDADPKLDSLVGCIKAIRTEKPSANILVYTEYTDSLRKVQERLNAEKVGTLLTLQGSPASGLQGCSGPGRCACQRGASSAARQASQAASSDSCGTADVCGSRVELTKRASFATCASIHQPTSNKPRMTRFSLETVVSEHPSARAISSRVLPCAVSVATWSCRGVSLRSSASQASASSACSAGVGRGSAGSDRPGEAAAASDTSAPWRFLAR